MIGTLTRLNKARARVATAVAALCTIASVGLLASPASAATPTLTVRCPWGASCSVTGSGFTPGGTVQVQDFVGTASLSSYTVTASPSTLSCVTGLKPICHQVGGGGISTTLLPDPNLSCPGPFNESPPPPGSTAAGTVTVTDVKTGSSASAAVTLVGPCKTATTTTLTMPTTVDIGFSLGVPALVMAASAVVGTGTVDIQVDGADFCRYTAGSVTGCGLLTLRAGTHQVQALYLGSGYPDYYVPSSSALVNVTVLQVQSTTSGMPGTTLGGYRADAAAGQPPMTTISGSWTVPTANCGTIPTGDVRSISEVWVGLVGGTTVGGGFPGFTNESLGTEVACTGYAPQYSAWYSAAPSALTVCGSTGNIGTVCGSLGPTSISDPVFPGDVMHANVSSTATPGSFTLTLKDDNQGWTYATTQPVAGAQGQVAMWGVSQPDPRWPLTNFGSVTFTNCRATGGNSSGVPTPIWDRENQAFTEGMNNLNSGTITNQASPSPLSNDGTQFTVTHLHG
jgi:hypothetical protein